jgi:dipeptidyl aminopeptidase/acylaminoacyl peptidase
MYRNLCLSIVFVCIGLVISAQSLILDSIMKGEEYVGNQPFNHTWAIDGETVLFTWNPENQLTPETYYWQKGMIAPKVLPNEMRYLTEVPTDNQKEEQEIYYLKSGGIYSYNKSTKKVSKKYITNERITGLTRGTNPAVLYFRKEDNIFSFDLKENQILQVTNFIKGRKPPGSGDKSGNQEKTNFLKQQQEELFLYVQEAKLLSKWNEEKAKETKEKTIPKEWYTEQSFSFISPTPDGKYVIFGLSEPSPNIPTRVESFITGDGYTASQNARAKVSVNNQYKTQLAIYDINKDTVKFIDFSKLSGIKTPPKYFQEYPENKDTIPKVKNLRFFSPLFNKDGSKAVIDIRSQDNKDRWIVRINFKEGNITELDHQHDEAWISGPGIGTFRGNLGFLKDNKTLYFQSEESGYSHIYLTDTENNTKKALTSGRWEVREASLSNDGSIFYLTTNTSHPGNREFYKLEISSGKMTAILNKTGAHEVAVSPDESTLLVRNSYKNIPWDLYTGKNDVNPELTRITSSESQSFKQYKWRDPEVITFKAKDGKNVYARVYTPPAKKKNKAAVIFVHGAGYLQNAHNFWSNYHREYMFHNLLADKGYTVLDIDYRGSDGYGRDVRTGIYRHMGGLDLSDHVDGRKFLIEKQGIDPDRIGIYGGSYGGFITLMALLTEPGKFKAGAALRSVTDWAHYNHGYTSNILNYPETDTIAYKRSSPIYFAQNLSDKLLMLHGMVDDNVQFQDIVRLTQRFIESGRKNWDLAVYPVEAHGFVKTYSWTDEYRRILDLFEEELKKR